MLHLNFSCHSVQYHLYSPACKVINIHINTRAYAIIYQMATFRVFHTRNCNPPEIPIFQVKVASVFRVNGRHAEPGSVSGNRIYYDLIVMELNSKILFALYKTAALQILIYSYWQILEYKQNKLQCQSPWKHEFQQGIPVQSWVRHCL